MKSSHHRTKSSGTRTKALVRRAARFGSILPFNPFRPAWLDYFKPRPKEPPPTDASILDPHANASEWVYLPPEERQAKLQDYGLGDYEIDPTFNDKRLAVLHHKTSDHSMIVHRGTSPSGNNVTGYNANDLFSDAYIIGDSYSSSSRYKESLERTYQAIEGRSDRDWTTTGHSLGGTTAYYVGRETGIDSYSINPGHSLNGNYDAPENQGGNHHIYLTEGDILSSGAANEALDDALVHKGKKKKDVSSPHSTQNWVSQPRSELEVTAK